MHEALGAKIHCQWRSATDKAVVTIAKQDSDLDVVILEFPKPIGSSYASIRYEGVDFALPSKDWCLVAGEHGAQLKHRVCLDAESYGNPQQGG